MITFVALLVCGKSRTAEAQGMSYTDSLWVRLGDSVVVTATDGSNDKYLEFSVFIMRPNSDWNIGGGAKDTLLGNVDFYYSYNKDAFDGNPSFLSETHGAVDFSSGGTGVGSLKGNAGENAGRMLISLRKKLPEQDGRTLFEISQREWMLVCRVKWKLKKDSKGAYQANLNIAWDLPATGLMTFGGYPIIDTLVGSIMKNPDPTLRIINESNPRVLACEGGVAQFVTTAESSGDALRYIWYDSIPSVSGWNEIGRSPADPNVSNANPHTNSRGAYKYSINSLGDTLSILDLPGRMDSIFVKCIVDDASIGYTPGIASGVKRLFVRDSVRVFLSSAAKKTAGLVDTVSKCAGVPATIYVNVAGLSRAELISEVDTLYITCRFINEEGNRGEKYLKIIPKIGASTIHDPINGQPVFSWAFQVADTVGKFYISGVPGSVSTYHCDNGRALWTYDSVVIKEGGNSELPRMIVSAGEEIILDQDNSDGHLGSTPLARVLNKNVLLGSVSGSSFPIYYTANNKAGLDTVVYRISGGGCDMIREVEVIDKKYLSLKVLLAGPYVGLDRQGRDSMNCIRGGFFPTDALGYVSPYNSNEHVEELPKLDGTLCDWIYIKLRDGEHGNYVDSVSVFLRQDGIVCDTAGNPYLAFKNLEKNSYHVVVEHRNHIAVMTANPVVLNAANPTTILADLTQQLTDLYNLDSGVPPAYNSTGKVLMFALDFNQNGLVNIVDKIIVMQNNGIVGYHVGDANFNGATNLIDLLFFEDFNTSRIGFIK